ncbi:MAG: hypothetical protein SCALA701_26240 [Candidatus Scalindua sp.]|nr:MAG: hypothetical protein SCALA701_26240 [Candidatus Scalindua sp.]
MATTQLEIERPFLSEQSLESAMSREYRTIEDDFETQIHLLSNPDLVHEVIKNLDLKKEFDAIYGVDVEKAIFSTPPFAKSNSSEKLPENIDSKDPIEMQTSDSAFVMDEVAKWYRSNINIEPIGTSYLVNISFKGPTREMAVRVANAHAHAFVEKNIELQYREFQKTIDWLKIQLEEQKKKVEESVLAIHNYKKKYNIVSFMDRENIVSHKLVELNYLLIQANAEMMKKKTAYDQLQTFSLGRENPFSLPEFKEDTVIQKLRLELVDLKAKKTKLASIYRAKHPKTLEINSRLNKLEKDIILEVQQIKIATKAELDRAVSKVDVLQNELDNYKQEELSFNEKTINYDVLKREAESNQNIYDILLKEVRETSLIGDTRRSNIRIIHEAKLPRSPIKPKKALNILLSIIFSLVFGVGLAFFLEYMDKSVKTPEDVSRHLDMSVLGIIPYDKSLKLKKIPALLTDESLLGERRYDRNYYQYDIMTNLLPKFSLMQTDKSGQILMVESTTSGEGKSSVLARSAINLARQGLRVLMVDADVQRPSLHDMFGINGSMEKGLLGAISKVLSLNIQEGTLDSYSVDDLFSLIALNKQSGRLTITNDSQTMTAVFDKGCFLHLQNRDVPCSNRLGTMLLNGGVITECQLKDALERNQRTGLPLGYILLNAGYINQNQLHGPIKLQMEEQLQKLFSWKQGSFSFEPASIKSYEDKKIHFWEDYVPIINRLGCMGGNRYLEDEILSHVVSLNEPNLSLLPAGRGSEKSGSLLFFTLLSKFLDILKQHFNVILVDAPPILDTLNSFKPLFSMVDGVIFVIKPGQASIKDTNAAVNCIKESQTKIIGTVLNQVKKGQIYY